MSNSNNNGLLLLLGTVVSLVGLAYLFSDKKHKLRFDKEKDGFKTDAEKLRKDWENIGGDFQRAKEAL